MERRYKVTIGLPIYNAEKYLRESLLSALAQTFPDIEYLILDDCGTDGSMDIVRQLQHEHPRGKDIRIVSQEFNKGIGAARNRILKEARGEFLYFMDADDLIAPNTIYMMVGKATKYEAQVVMASYKRVELYHDEPVSSVFQHPDKVFSVRNSFAPYAFSHYGMLQANIWNVLMEVDLIRRNGLQFVNTNFWEDLAFKYELVTYVSRAVLMSNITYTYMCRENSLSNFQDRKVISKDEIFRNVATMDTLKSRYDKILWRPFFAKWLQFVLDTDYFVIRDVLQKRDRIKPAVTDQELRDILYSPLSVFRTLRHGNLRCWFYKLLSILPPRMAVSIIKRLP